MNLWCLLVIIFHSFLFLNLGWLSPPVSSVSQKPLFPSHQLSLITPQQRIFENHGMLLCSPNVGGGALYLRC